jgi:hypothetical protein
VTPTAGALERRAVKTKLALAADAVRPRRSRA